MVVPPRVRKFPKDILGIRDDSPKRRSVSSAVELAGFLYYEFAEAVLMQRFLLIIGKETVMNEHGIGSSFSPLEGAPWMGDRAGQF